MLRDYELQREIFNQYITKDKGDKECTLVKKPNKRAKYKRNVITNDELVEKQYGLSKQELDTLIEEMAETYNYQWKVVSNALYKEHNIIISDRALNFRYFKLHPRNQKCGYNQDESLQLIKLFYVEGKRYKQINQRFGYRGQHSIRNVLYQFSFKGFSKLQYFLRDEIMELPKQTIIDKKRSRKAFLLQTLILNYGLKWDYNRHSLALFYVFIVSPEEELVKVPKQLAILLYKRFIELIDEKKQQKKEMYELIKPNLYEQLELVKQERNRLCANMFRIMKSKDRSNSDISSAYSREQNIQGHKFAQAPHNNQIRHDQESCGISDINLDEISVFSHGSQKSLFNELEGVLDLDQTIQNAEILK